MTSIVLSRLSCKGTWESKVGIHGNISQVTIEHDRGNGPPGFIIRDSLAIHVILAFLFVKFALLLGGSILVLLVLRNQVVHVGLSFGELHLVHSLTSVPMKECLTAEHSCEVFGDTLEHFLDSGRVSQKSHCHLEALGWDIADASLNVVRDPFHEVGAVLVLHVKHLLIDLLCTHPATEQGSSSEIPAMTWISSAHHVLRVEHLLGQLWNCEGPVLLRTTGCERREANHEEVQPWEWNEIDSEFAQIPIELTRKAKACCHSTHSCTHEVVQVTICRRCQLQGPEANVIQCFVVKQHALVSIFHQLMEREHCVVWLHYSVRNLW